MKKANDIIRDKMNTTLNEQKQHLLCSLREIGIWERADIEPFIDEMKRQVWQAHLKQRSWLKLEENYSKHELGLRAVMEVDTYNDKGGDEWQINKAIQKVGAVSGKVSGRKQRKARELLTTLASAGYYAYLVLRKKLGIPCEHPILREWYAKFLPYIPSLINPGGIIQLKEGTYDITDNIKLRNDLIIEGAGRATLLKANADAVIEKTNADEYLNLLAMLYNDPLTSYENIVIRDLAIDGQRSATGDNANFRAIRTEATKNLLIDNIWILSSGFQGINLQTYGAACTERVVVSNCKITDIYHYAIALYPGNLSAVVNNIIYTNVTNAIKSSACVDALVANNVITDVSEGIVLFGKYVNVINNTIKKTITHGVEINYSSSEYNLVAYNKIHDVGFNVTTRCYILIGNVSASNNNLIVGNEMRQIDSTNTPDVAIKEVSGDYNKIIGNIIAAGDIVISGANTLVRDNFGWKDIKTVTADYAMSWADESILADASSAAITVTLPDPASYPNEALSIKKIDSSTNAVTVAPHGSETIDGAASVSLANQWDSVTVKSDGTNWYVL